MQLPSTSFQRIRVGRMTVVFALSFFVALESVSAQELSPVGAVAGRRSGDTVLVASSPTHEGQTRSLDGPLRIGAGLLGSAAGFVIGGIAGAGTAAGCRGELCQFGPALLGGAVGSVAFAALTSAAPRLASTCSADARVSRGVVGGITGALTGGVLGLVGGPLCILTYVAGAGIGAGWAASSCGNG
jgi:hypothetical protein